MGPTCQTSRALDDEHRHSLALLGRAEKVLARACAVAPPDLARLARELIGHAERDVGRHFDFEERELFPRLADAGEADMAALLEEEHEAIRSVMAELLPLLHDAAEDRIDQAGLALLERLVGELVERQVAHIQKESMALLPMLDQLLDDETDRQLSMAQAEA